MAHLGELKFKLRGSEGQRMRSFSCGFGGLRGPCRRVNSPWLRSGFQGPAALLPQGCLLCSAMLARPLSGFHLF